MRTRMTAGSALLALGLLLGVVVPTSASSPQVSTWTNQAVDAGYFWCGSTPITGDWMVSHTLKIFFNADGTPTRDIETIDYTGAFVNPANGLSIADSGRSTFFDTLAPDYSYISTMMNGVRHSAYFHAAGRTDFQTGAHVGVDKYEVGLAAACVALGA